MLRPLRRHPGFALVTVLTMALGTSAAATLFTLAYSVLLKPLPWPDPERLVMLEERRDHHRPHSPWTVTNGIYHALSEAPITLQQIGCWMSSSQTLAGVHDRQRVRVAAVTPSLFRVLKANAAVGRLFIDEDVARDRPRTVVLSFGLWQRRFGGDRSVIGRALQLDDTVYDIVGVMPRGFAFPDRDTELWSSFRPLPLMRGRQMSVILLGAIARLRPGVSHAQVAAEAAAKARGVPDNRDVAMSLFGGTGSASVSVAPVLDVMTADVRPALALLLCAAGLLFAATTASALSVQLARATGRRLETATRAALGAGLPQLVSLWVKESVALGLCGGLVGIGLSVVFSRLLAALLPADFPRIDAVGLDGPALLFLLSVTVAIGVVCGIVPALLTRPSKLAPALSEDGIAAIGLAMRTPAARLRATSIGSQVAIACVLLIGGALLARSFVAMTRVDRGYDPRGLLTARVTFPHEHSSRHVPTLEALSQRLRSVPGVRQAAFGNGLPLVDRGRNFDRVVPSPRDPSRSLQVTATWRVVSPNYLDALGARPIAGRSLAWTDVPSSPSVIVVNRSFARRYLDGDPVGQRLRLGLSPDDEWAVVGVVEDMRHDALSEPTNPEFYVSSRQLPDRVAWDPMLLLRTGVDRTFDVPTLRAVVRSVDSALVLDDAMSMEDRVTVSLARPRVYALVVGWMALLALALAGVSIFGVLSYTTAQRTPEIGVRASLGAGPRDIVALVVRQAATMIGLGLLAGVAATLFIVDLLSKFLFGITTRDLVSFLAGPVLVALVGVAASAVPALRAAMIDPVRALRSR